ncbi:hypothetical protein B2G71_19460 [Novosphingobium sp. PC22D]|jgi:hypothetical protein|nr:hypothetical protein [Novosphingobium sp. PC22D]PEQ10993.1 hypothetical protein B2G71_19460 [Novosphingobium sp. PC22D]GGN55394.1 hypothetical protein GCM10011349_32010 [Novosphingobium indicum]
MAFARTAPRPNAQASIKAFAQSFLATGLRLLGWVSVNALVAVGAVTMALCAVANFSLEGFMHQLANLSSRYITADAARQHQFDAILLWVLAVVFALAGIFRRQSLAHILLKEFDDDTAS